MNLIMPNCSKNTAKKLPAFKADPALQITASILSGTAVPDKNNAITGSKEYSEYKAKMDILWKKIQKDNVDPIGTWRKENLNDSLMNKDVTYFMSGVDFINVNNFFPNSKEYLLIAREPMGKIPEITEENKNDIFYYMYKSLQWYSRYNYFTTVQMKDQISKSKLKGALPVFIFFINRLGHEIAGIEHFKLDEKGEMNLSKPEDAIGIRIKFLDRNKKDLRELIYLNTLVQNQILDVNVPVGKFMEKRRNHRAHFLKSAEYFFHLKRYQLLSEYIASGADIVIEDDSGVPFRYFSNSKWNHKLFGEYKKPMPLAELKNPPMQTDLAAAFAKESYPIHFPFGYGSLKHPERSNLLLLTRTAPQ